MIQIDDPPDQQACAPCSSPPAACRVSGCKDAVKYGGLRLCQKHYKRIRNHGTTELPARVVDRAALMWAKLDVADCWIFTGYIDVGGYGSFWDGARVVKAHRWTYEYLVGEIKAGLELDHLCKQRSCCNPDHLEPVTPRVNTLRSYAPTAIHARKTHCIQGHPLSGDNLIVQLRPQGPARICRVCDCRKKRLRKARRRVEK